MNNSLKLLYPEAVSRLTTDLERAASDWDYLSAVSGNGPVAEFEQIFSAVSGGKHAIAMTNATSALLTALMAAGVGRGDEVILPSHTWPQTLTPVLIAGATPVFADIEKRSASIDPKSVRRLITEKTKAIIGVHLYGIPADAPALEKIAAKYKCSLIFDAAQGFGSQFNNKPIGEYGDFVAYSFGRSKLFSIGEGGALICKTQKLFEKAVAFSQHPLRMHKDIDDIALRHAIDGVSMNFRMHPLIASLAIGQLEGFVKSGKLKKLHQKFNEACSLMNESGHKGLLPSIPTGALPSGVCLPLLITKREAFDKCSLIIREMGLEWYEGGLQSPLHLSRTVLERQFPFAVNSRRKHFTSHLTHRKGSCPITEKRMALPQVFLKTS